MKWPEQKDNIDLIGPNGKAKDATIEAHMHKLQKIMQCLTTTKKCVLFATTIKEAV